MDNHLGQQLLSLIGKDIKTNFNVIKTTDKNDIISFLPDGQTTTKLKDVSIESLFDIDSNNKTSIGRLVRAILKDNKITFVDKDIEDFVNDFKATYEMVEGNVNIKIVSGEEIRDRYHVDGYSQRTMSGSGTLGKSCMRYSDAQSYLDIYAFNPDVCRLVIKLDERGKLEARALLWTTNKGLFLDRVYYTDDSDEDLLNNWVKVKFDNKVILYEDSYTGLEVQLTKGDDKATKSSEFPYMDSLPYYSFSTCKLYSYETKVKEDRKGLIYMHDTEGGYDEMNLIYSDYHRGHYMEEDLAWSVMFNSYLRKDLSHFIEYYNDWVPGRECGYCEVLDEYRLYSDLVSVNINLDGDEEFYPKQDSHSKDYKKDVNGDYYLNELLEEYDGNFYVKGQTTKAYKVFKTSLAKFQQIYNTKYDRAFESDKVFGIKMSKKYEMIDNSTFYELSYSKMIYSDVEKILDSLEQTDEVIAKKKEIRDINSQLCDESSFYRYNNILHDEFGSADKVMQIYQNHIKYAMDNTTIRALLDDRAVSISDDKQGIIDYMYYYIQNPHESTYSRYGSQYNKHTMMAHLSKFKLKYDILSSFRGVEVIIEHCIGKVVNQVLKSDNVGSNYINVFNLILENPEIFSDNNNNII